MTQTPLTQAQTETSRQLVVDYFEAMGTQDQAALARLEADDVEWNPPASAPMEGCPYVGRDAVAAAMYREGARFFDLTTGEREIGKIVADGDTVVVATPAPTRRMGRRA